MSDKVFEQLKAVRDSGETNMLDFRGVFDVAERQGLYELTNWMGSKTASEYVVLLVGPFSEWLENQAAVEYLEEQDAVGDK